MREWHILAKRSVSLAATQQKTATSQSSMRPEE
jgi:hypothetical protein